MRVNFNDLKTELSKNKVFDAWQYVESLLETLNYMEMSSALIKEVYDQQRNMLDRVSQNALEEAHSNPRKAVAITRADLSETCITIGEIKISSDIFLRKTVLEFFHYARLSLDILSQIINAALFGDDAFPIETLNLPKKISDKLQSLQEFHDLHAIISSALNNNEICYMMAFDNYVKHIKTILVSISYGMLFSTGNNVFAIKSFIYKNQAYEDTDAITKINAVENAVEDVIDQSLTELLRQIPNCQGNTNRYQLLKFKLYFKENEEGHLRPQYVSFFLEVENGIDDLDANISIMPLVIKPDGKICNYFFDFDTVFITLKEKGEDGICGIAKAEPTRNSNELYRKFSVEPATIQEYNEYKENFQQNYSRIHLDYNAIEGEIVIENAEPKQEPVEDEQ